MNGSLDPALSWINVHLLKYKPSCRRCLASYDDGCRNGKSIGYDVDGAFPSTLRSRLDNETEKRGPSVSINPAKYRISAPKLDICINFDGRDKGYRRSG